MEKENCKPHTSRNRNTQGTMRSERYCFAFYLGLLNFRWFVFIGFFWFPLIFIPFKFY